MGLFGFGTPDYVKQRQAAHLSPVFHYCNKCHKLEAVKDVNGPDWNLKCKKCGSSDITRVWKCKCGQINPLYENVCPKCKIRCFKDPNNMATFKSYLYDPHYNIIDDW